MLLLASAASPLPCPDNNSKCFHSIAMKLYNSVNRHKRKIKFDWRHYRIFYARVMPPFRQMLPLGDTSGVLVFIILFSQIVYYTTNISIIHLCINQSLMLWNETFITIYLFLFFQYEQQFSILDLGTGKTIKCCFCDGTWSLFQNMQSQGCAHDFFFRKCLPVRL